ncbi:hypothetical protein [Xanthocytophaga flava]|nr:hypothetical protein [Xanthocytophaga flavus]MDJ1472443.1 hypothetical protein [Xanthocytophaga flavus]
MNKIKKITGWTGFISVQNVFLSIPQSFNHVQEYFILFKNLTTTEKGAI